jgi:hypothetical protein
VVTRHGIIDTLQREHLYPLAFAWVQGEHGQSVPPALRPIPRSGFIVAPGV